MCEVIDAAGLQKLRVSISLPNLSVTVVNISITCIELPPASKKWSPQAPRATKPARLPVTAPQN